MRKIVFAFPEWIEESLVDDALFAHAYDAASDQERALLKTGIARLYDWYGPRKDRGGEVRTRWRGGFDTVSRHAPVDFVVLLLDGEALSPARALAGLVPAVACGVEQILAVRVGAEVPWHPSLLVGLELAGQERVADMDVGQWIALRRELSASGHAGLIVDLTGDGQGGDAEGHIVCCRPDLGRTADVWMDEDEPFDLEALAFAHPGVNFIVHGAVVPLPGSGFSRGGEDFQEFLDGTGDVAYVPALLTEAALEGARLVLGPGHEGCWLWPDLHSAFFQLHRNAWTIGG